MSNSWIPYAFMAFAFLNVFIVGLIIYKRFSGPEPGERKR